MIKDLLLKCKAISGTDMAVHCSTGCLTTSPVLVLRRWSTLSAAHDVQAQPMMHSTEQTLPTVAHSCILH